MNEAYRVTLVDFPGTSRLEASLQLANAFGVSKEVSDQMVEQMPAPVKESAPLDEAHEYVQALTAIGATVTLENTTTGHVERFTALTCLGSSQASEPFSASQPIDAKNDAKPTWPSAQWPAAPRLNSPAGSRDYQSWTKAKGPSDHKSLFIGGGVILVLLVLFAIWAAGPKSHDTYLVNALGVPVTVQFGDEVVSVPAQSYLKQSFKDGTYVVTAKNADGMILSTETVVIPGGDSVAAYNVLGAADLYVENVEYRTDFRPNDNPDYELRIGRTFVVEEDIDYLFVAPPDEIQITTNTAYRRYFGFVDPSDWGWRCSLDVLVGHEFLADAMVLASTIDRWDTTAQAQVYLDALLANPPVYDEYAPEYERPRYPY